MSKLTTRFVINLLSIASVTLIAGCSLKPVQYSPSQTYVLSPSVPTTTAKPTQLTLLVESPKATQAFDTTQMAYVNKPYQLTYFSYNQWADTPAQMLHPLLIQALQNTGHFHAVIANPNTTQYDVVLKITVLQLQQSFLQKPSQIQFNVRAQLVNNTSHQVIATQQFNITEAAAEDTPYGGVIAANKATEKLLQQITQFCLDNTKHI